MKIKIQELTNITLKAIKHYGYNEEEATSILNVLMYAQIRGNNQGIVKLIGNGIPKRKEAQPPKTIKETPVSALIDGNKTHAIIVMDHITNIAIEKAQISGIGITGNYNTSESTGAIGYYVNKIAEQGLIGIAFSSSPFQTTAPYGSNEPKYCTNPLAYGIPTETDPIVLDMSTSAMAYYGLIQAKVAGTQIPEGIGYDAQGKETTNPTEIMSGALKTFGGHKGAGLALIVQILAGAFVKADSFNNDSDNAGNLVIAIDPNIFLDTKEFKTNVSQIIQTIKSARKIDGVKEIMLPGERGNKEATKNKQTGEIEVEDNLLNNLKEVAGE